MTSVPVSQRKKILSSILKIAIPTVVTVGLCIVLFTGIDFHEMMAVIRRDCNFGWIALGMALSVVAQVIRAWRWKLQLNALGIYPGFFAIVLSIFGTYAVNMVFPRLGEIWRTGYISARENAQFTTVFGSMVADRVADMVLVLLLALTTLALASPAVVAFVERYPDVYNAMANLVASPWLWAALAATCVVITRLYVKMKHHRLVMKIRKVLVDLWKGFAVVLTMRHRTLWTVLSFALWGCYFLQLYVAFFAFPVTEGLLQQNGIICALVCFVLSSMAMAVPSNGGIGPWQLAVVFALTLYAPAELGPQGMETFRVNVTAFANVVMGMETLLLIVLGIITFVCIFFEKRRNVRAR